MLKNIKKIAETEGKKIGKKAIDKIASLLEKQTEILIKKSARNADFAGRKIIKPEDIEVNV